MFKLTWWVAVAGMMLIPAAGPAQELPAPWGVATEVHQTYDGQKVVYDADSPTPDKLRSVIDRASYLSRMNGANPFDTRVVVVVHGEALHAFARQNYAEHAEIMARAQSLSVGDVVEFRICAAGARRRGYAPEDFHGFATVVPMADAEIVRLQQEEGFAFMR
ncbi:DsrE family protein [Thioalkalivibrio sulfidiphilus]|uniref:DsrE family protein n=1 Tax=Thioalkalivibrio sulfidiphilus TaxID=1033854 RepID=UPI003B3750AB